MLAATLRISGYVTRRLLIAAMLGLVGLSIGAACVLTSATIPFGIIGAASLILLWVLPELSLIPVNLGEFLIHPFVFSIIAIPQYYALVFEGAPWISIRRVILFSLILATTLIIAGSAGYRSLIKQRLRDSYILSIFTIGYLAAQFLSLLTSVNPGNSVGDIINTVLNLYIPLAAVLCLLHTTRQIKQVIATMLSALLVSTAIGAIEFVIRHRFLFKVLPGSVISQILAQNGTAPLNAIPDGDPSGPYRATSTFMVPLSWSEFAMMMAPLALHFATSGSRHSTKFLGIVSLLASCASIVFSGSRGGYVGFLAGCALFILVHTFRFVYENRHSALNPLLVISYSMASVSVACSILFVDRIHNTVLGNGARQASNQGRHEQWAIALQKLPARPFTGYGAGNAADVVHWLNPKGFISLDSYVINVLMSSGIIGAVLFFGMFLVPLTYCLPRNFEVNKEDFFLKVGIVSSLFGYTVYRTTLNQSENNTLAFVMIGLLIVLNATKVLPDDLVRLRENRPVI